MTHAELISIGDELLIGQTINTNASWLGQQLAAIGIRVTHTAVISDEKKDIIEAIDSAFSRADLVIVTGGLGPTKDDITKHVLCDYFDSQLIENKVILEHIESFFRLRNRPMLAVNTQQALFPEKAEVLFNRQGTAAGMWFNRDKKVLISMPGVPYEMKTIFSEEAIPKIKQQFATVNLYHRTVLTQGIGESFLADKMSDWENRLRAEGFGLAYLPSPGMVKLRLTSYTGDDKAPRIDAYVQELKNEIPRYAFGEGEISLSEVVGNRLKANNQTIGTVESCTGGAISAELIRISGASDYVKGSLVTYSYELKTAFAGVSEETLSEFGAVSEQVVSQMATNGRKTLGVDWCVAVSGIAGPAGGTEEKPVGTVWMAIANHENTIAKRFNFGDNRERNIQMTVLSALNYLRRTLLQLD